MQRFIIVRILQSFLCLWAVSLIVFLVVRLSGNPLDLMLPAEATQEDRAVMMRELGLDRAMPVQYGVFLSRVLRGDFGTSIRTRRPALDLFLERLPATLELGFVALLVSLAIALPVGVYAAAKRGSLIDIVGRGMAVLGQSFPVFWLGLMLMLIFAVRLDLLPTSGRGGPLTFIMPAITMGWYVAAGVMRLTRSSMLDVLGSDYIRLARAKGVSLTRVLWKHAFKNAALPVLTFSAVVLVHLFTGSVITETVFSWPGVGRLVIDAIKWRDYPLVQTAVIMMSAMYIMANLFADIMYAYINPKIRYGR